MYAYPWIIQRLCTFIQNNGHPKIWNLYCFSSLAPLLERAGWTHMGSKYASEKFLGGSENLLGNISLITLSKVIYLITLPTKVHLVKTMVFPIVRYRCESWTTKKAECRRIDAFEMWCWRRLLRVPWTARRSNQSILVPVAPQEEALCTG